MDEITPEVIARRRYSEHCYQLAKYVGRLARGEVKGPGSFTQEEVDAFISMLKQNDTWDIWVSKKHG